MSTAELLTTLATTGITLRRLPGDKLEITGPLSEAMREQVVNHKPELLTLLPDPDAELNRMWQKVIHEGNAITPPTWFPSADDWQRLDAIEAAFDEAKAAGDIEAMRKACGEYLDEIHRQLMIDEIHKWADRFCARCGFDRTDGQVICHPCRERMRQERQHELSLCPPCHEPAEH